MEWKLSTNLNFYRPIAAPARAEDMNSLVYIVFLFPPFSLDGVLDGYRLGIGIVSRRVDIKPFDLATYYNV